MEIGTLYAELQQNSEFQDMSTPEQYGVLTDIFTDESPDFAAFSKSEKLKFVKDELPFVVNPEMKRRQVTQLSPYQPTYQDLLTPTGSIKGKNVPQIIGDMLLEDLNKTKERGFLGSLTDAGKHFAASADELAAFGIRSSPVGNLGRLLFNKDIAQPLDYAAHQLQEEASGSGMLPALVGLAPEFIAGEGVVRQGAKGLSRLSPQFRRAAEYLAQPGVTRGAAQRALMDATVMGGMEGISPQATPQSVAENALAGGVFGSVFGAGGRLLKGKVSSQPTRPSPSVPITGSAFDVLRGIKRTTEPVPPIKQPSKTEIPPPVKPTKGSSKPTTVIPKEKSKTAIKNQEISDFLNTLDTVASSPTGDVIPIKDFLGKYSIKFSRSKKGDGKNNDLFFPGIGAIKFTDKDSLYSVWKRLNVRQKRVFAGMAREKGGTVESFRDELDILSREDTAETGLVEARIIDIHERQADEALSKYDRGMEELERHTTEKAYKYLKEYDTVQTEKQWLQLEREFEKEEYRYLPDEFWKQYTYKTVETSERLDNEARTRQKQGPPENKSVPERGSSTDEALRGKTEAKRGFPGEEKPIGLGGLKPSERQAQGAAVIKKSREKEEQEGAFKLFETKQSTQSQSQAFDPQAAGVENLVGATRPIKGWIDKQIEGFKDKFIYMHTVKDKIFNIAGKKVFGEQFITHVDILRTAIQDGRKLAEEKVKNAIIHLKDTPGYTTLQKLDDVTQYLLYADYLSRFKKGMEVPGGLTLQQLQDGYKAIAKHISKNPDLRKTVLNVRRLLDEIGNDLVKMGVIEKTHKHYFPHQVLEHVIDKYGMPGVIRKPFRGYAQKAVGSQKEVETDLIQALTTHFTLIAKHNAIDDFVKNVLKDFADPNWKLGKPIPDGFTEYQPIPGNVHFQSFTVPDQAIMNAVLQQLIGIKDPKVVAALSEIKTALSVGGKRKTYIVPDEIATLLMKIYEPTGSPGLIKKIVQTWKEIVTTSIFNPKLIVYHIKNAFGDTGALGRDDPKAFGKTVESLKVILSKDPKADPLFAEASKMGTTGAGFYGEELGFQGDWYFKRQFSKNPIDRLLTRTPLIGDVTKLISRINNFVRASGEKREAVLRFAKYISDREKGLEPWQAHIENGKTFINYAHLTPFEREWFRDTLYPFWTWYKGNFVNWVQAWTGQRGKEVMLRSGVLGFGIPLAVSIWNRMAFPEDEEELNTSRSKGYLANQLHLITGSKDSQDRPIIHWLPTSSNAALQITGLAKAPTRIAKVLVDVYEGKSEMTESLKTEISRFFKEDFLPEIGPEGGVRLPAPIKETTELLNPFIKEGLEQTFNWDLFLGRPIRRNAPNMPEGENRARTIKHLLKVTTPPLMTWIQAGENKSRQDPGLIILDFIVGTVKAPDLYSWSDLKDEERKWEKAQTELKNKPLKEEYIKVKEALFHEAEYLVYDARFGEEKKRYGQELNPQQRLRVTELLNTATQGSGITYSAQGKNGLMHVIKELDTKFQDFSPDEQQKVLGFVSNYRKLMEDMGDMRIRSAVTAVQKFNNPKLQLEFYKAGTSGLDTSPTLKELSKQIEFINQRKRTD